MARMGALVGGGTEQQIEGLGRYFESLGLAFQMVDDVFLNGLAKGQPEAAKEVTKPQQPAAPQQQVAALPPVPAPRTPPSNEAVNAPIALFSRHNGGWTVVILDPRSDARDFLADG